MARKAPGAGEERGLIQHRPPPPASPSTLRDPPLGLHNGDYGSTLGDIVPGQSVMLEKVKRLCDSVCIYAPDALVYDPRRSHRGPGRRGGGPSASLSNSPPGSRIFPASSSPLRPAADCVPSLESREIGIYLLDTPPRPELLRIHYIVWEISSRSLPGSAGPPVPPLQRPRWGLPLLAG